MSTPKKEESPSLNMEAGSYSENSSRGPRVPQSNKEMTEPQFEAFVDEIMQLFRELEDLSDLRTLYETGKALSQTYFNCTPYRARVSARLISQGYPDYATKMLKKLNNLGVFKNDDIWFSSFYFYNTCWNYSDVSGNFASALGTAGLPSLLKLNIAHKPYLDNMQSRNVTYLLKATVSIIHNMVRDAANSHYFNERSVKDSLANLLSNENEMIHGLALSCLAYLVNEEETAILERGSSSVRYLVEWLDHALHKSGEKRRCRGFTPEEIASSLAAIAVNDSLKTTIVSEGALPHLVEMAGGARDGETAAAMRGLWNLSFDDTILTRLLAEYDLETMASRLKNHEEETVRKAAESVMWMASRRGKEAEPRAAGDQTGKPYVFISYAWVEQEMVLKVRERLREEGIDCWIDVEQMHKSTLDSMARGVEGCRAILCCASEAYRRSPNCRLELMYASRRNVPIVPALMQTKYRADGYLGILLADLLYFDLAGKKPFDQAMDALVQELRRILGQHDSTDVKVVDEPRINGDLVAPERVSEGFTSGRVRGWRTEDVATWLDRSGLGHVKLSMGQIDGDLLSQMAQLRRESPDFFYKSLDKKLGLTFVDSLKFVRALDKLKL